MIDQLPSKGFVFWPVCTGDSTTIAVTSNVVVQVDVHHMVCADGEDDPSIPVVDELVRLLPKRAGKPYLGAFVLTHPDTDHCKGFTELLERVTIGELWFTPRVFAEYHKDLPEEAKVFRKEALRRVKATIDAGGFAASGNRVRIIGYDDLLKEADYAGFPRARLTVPGNAVTEIDGMELAGQFRAFVHAPFKDDVAAERNDSSVGLQVRLTEGLGQGRALLFGDLCYPTVKRIFDASDADDLAWDVLLAPHHCSKSVMYWCDEGNDEESLKQDILDQLEAAAQPTAQVVASSAPIPVRNSSGDNPPHAKAKARYEEIIDTGNFVCTMEHPDKDTPEPIVFDVTAIGIARRATVTKASKALDEIANAIATARGGDAPPVDRVGFGRRR